MPNNALIDGFSEEKNELGTSEVIIFGFTDFGSFVHCSKETGAVWNHAKNNLSSSHRFDNLHIDLMDILVFFT